LIEGLGHGEPADEHSDISALGIVLYEMLTGRPSYDADTPCGVILIHINDLASAAASNRGSAAPGR
jgi:serine/threonine-protein kinase